MGFLEFLLGIPSLQNVGNSLELSTVQNQTNFLKSSLVTKLLRLATALKDGDHVQLYTRVCDPFLYPQNSKCCAHNQLISLFVNVADMNVSIEARKNVRMSGK